MGRKLADAVNGAIIQASSTVGLSLQSYTDMFYGTRNDRIGHAGESASEVILTVGERRIEGPSVMVPGLELTASPMKGTKLN